MYSEQVDAKNHDRIAEMGGRVLQGGGLTREEAMWLLNLEGLSNIMDLLSWANRVREHYKGNKVHLCSIVNIKAGGCSEDCKFCAQSSFYETNSPNYSLIDKEAVLTAADEAKKNNVTGLGIVAAWKGLGTGKALDEICETLEALKESGKARPDASLGIIRSQAVADRLRRSGLECYNHNLETSSGFFPKICTTHSYAERVQTIRYLKQAGIQICSGGILGLGESRSDRCDLAFALKELQVDFVPVNILNPIPGTPFGHLEPLAPMEVLKTIACFRLVLPTQEIMVAGGRVVNLRDLQCMVFMAGASAVMVGNYLTTVNQPVEKDLQMLKDLGLDPRWEVHGQRKGKETIPAEPVPAAALDSVPAEFAYQGRVSGKNNQKRAPRVSPLDV